jgi:hypothetical protein
VGDHALYQINKYASWGAFPKPFADRDELRASGVWQCFDAARAVDEIVKLVEEYPQLEDMHLFAALPGESMETATPRLRYIGEHVLPEARKRLAALGN